MMLELALKPGSGRFDSHHESWLAQQDGLFAELTSVVGPLGRRPDRVEGAKGWAETVIVSLASAGTFTMALQTIQTWLTRDRTRSIEISIVVNGVTQSFVLKGTEIDPDLVDRLTELAMSRLAERGDPAPQPLPPADS